MCSRALFLMVTLTSVGLTAQTAPSPRAALATDTASTSTPSVSFTLDFPGSTPEHYSITIGSSGKGIYSSGPSPSSAHANPASTDSGQVKTAKESSGSQDEDSDSESDAGSHASSGSSSDPFDYQFNVSEQANARIFELASKAHYFEGDLDYGKHNLANTGAKTLAYHDARRNTHSTYNYTTNQPAQELTTLFQNLSTTLEAGHRLSFYYQYQKLALEQELKRVEELSKSGGLFEVQTINPILKRIIADPSVMNVTRARAERLLAMSGNTSSR